MMTKEKMLERYNELYSKMAGSKDPKNMMIFGEAEKWVFGEMVKVHPDIAESWLSHLESVCWNNYLSEKEAMNIGKRITNQDGTKGFHWNHEVFTKAVESLGGKVEDKPYYNSYALCVAANSCYADHAISIAMDMGYDLPSKVPNEKMAMSCYRKAVEKLKDVDNPSYIRSYFRGKMYDNSPM